ncbi:hypothetical protein LCGC14_0161550 [marine sediment metagenome]|uniref:PKD domain-containing protein n=1 Tax=marine sediment metagenome TaxID=412755 RepID=A0A0F9XXQ4_9ZZZZ
MKKSTLLLSLISILAISGFFLTTKVEADLNDNVSGFAWSENIGWISFNCFNDYDGDGILESHCADAGYPSDYGVNVDLGTGLFSGYAWSEHIGWITFNSGELVGCPDGSCLAQLDIATNEVSGWARALAYGDGWDGWIKLRGTAGVPTCVNPDWECDYIDGPPTTGASAYININQVTGKKWISYKTLSPESLKATHYVGTGGNCGNGEWECEIVDDYQSGNFSSGQTSLAFDSSNNPWIVYVRHDPTGKIMIARYVGTGGTGCINSTNPGVWNCEIVEEGSALAYPDLVFDQGGTAWISYERANNLNVARRVTSGGSGCDGADNPNLWTCEKVDVSGWSEQGDSSIKVDSSGQILIAFRGIDLSVSPWDYGVLFARHVGSGGSGCINSDNPSEWNCELIEKYPSNISTIGQVRLALDSFDEPWITFYGPNKDIIVTRHVGSGGSGCINADNPSEWTCSVLDTGWSQSLPANSIRSSSGEMWVVYRGPDSNIWLGKFVGSGGNCKGSEWNCELIDDYIVVESFSSVFDPFGNLWFTKFTGITFGVVHYSPPPPDYGVSLNATPDPNEFEGWAWSDMNIGWMSFNCLNQGVCGASDYKVFIAGPVNLPPSATSLNVTQGNYCFISSPPIFLNWTYSDPDDVPLGTDPQSAYQVQVDNNSDFSSPEIDSGKVISASTDYSPPGLSFNTTYFWRVMVWDSIDTPSTFATGPSFSTLSRPPWPDFTWSPLEPAAGEIIQFTDQTTFYGTSPGWEWDFDGDGGTDSIEQNPTHSYSVSGDYIVELIAVDSDGSCSIQQTLTTGSPLPEWREISPTGLLEKFWASIFSFFQA